MKPLLVVDTEGRPEESGRHSLVMCSAAGETGPLYRLPRLAPQHVRSSPAQWQTWAEWLLQVSRHGILVSWWGDYDWSLFASYLPPRAAQVLVETGELKIGAWVFRWRPNRYFEAANRRARQVARIHEMGPWAGGLLAAGDRWQIWRHQAERDSIATGKSARGAPDGTDTALAAYQTTELRAAARLAERIRAWVRASTGVTPALWTVGGVAGAVLRSHGWRPSDWPDNELTAAVDTAFFGGRHEAIRRGPAPWPVQVWDLSSAYAWALSQLPCTRWDHHARLVSAETWVQPTLASVEWALPPGAEIGPLPVRTPSGGTAYPAEWRAGGLWWWPEARAAAEQWPGRVRITGGHEITECARGCPPPLRWVPDLYSLRSAGAGPDYAAKRLLAALWGRLAQRHGDAPQRDRLAAGLATALVRARVLAAAASADGLVAITGDGLVARHWWAPTGTEIGEWRMTQRTGWVQIQAGVAWSDDTAQSRGLGASRDELAAAVSEGRSLHVRHRRHVSARRGLRERRPWPAWEITTTSLSLAPGPRRRAIPDDPATTVAPLI